MHENWQRNKNTASIQTHLSVTSKEYEKKHRIAATAAINHTEISYIFLSSNFFFRNKFVWEIDYEVNIVVSANTLKKCRRWINNDNKREIREMTMRSYSPFMIDFCCCCHWNAFCSYDDENNSSNCAVYVENSIIFFCLCVTLWISIKAIKIRPQKQFWVIGNEKYVPIDLKTNMYWHFCCCCCY